MSRWSLLLRLIGFLRPFAGWVALSVLLGVATVASGIGLLGTSASLIAQAALHPSVAALQVAIVGVRFFGISRAVFRYLERLVSHSANFRLLAELRAWFYRQIEPLAPAGLQDERSGDLLSRAIADIETLENFYVRAVAPPLVALVITLGMGWFVGQYDPHFTYLLVTALVVNGVLLPLLAYFLSRRPAQEVVDRRARLNTSLLDSIQGMPDLLAFGQAQNQLERIEAEGAALGLTQVRLARSGALANAIGNLVAGLALWGILFVGIPLAGEQLSGISLAVLALVTLASFEAVNPLVQASQHLESSLQAARRLFSLVLVEPEIVPPAQPAPAPAEMSLCIRGLTFSYQNDRAPALIDFDLDLPVGKKVALLGVSGAGKSTLFNVLMRFWDFNSGTIELGRRDIRSYHPRDVRSQIALIDSSTYLFAGTLRQNLLVARPTASDDELDRAIQLAQLSGLAARLPSGIDTWLGERGVQLSGGERQRVAIARALLKDAELLLLDEPTAHLDAENERSLLAALREASAGRSVIYITHSLMGLEGMDEIIILKSGRVVECGTHAGLQVKGGEYIQYWKL